MVAVVPFGKAGVPDRLEAVPLVFWFNVGNEVNDAALPSVASKVFVPAGNVDTLVSSGEVKVIDRPAVFT